MGFPEMARDDAPNRICVGRIAGAHGVQGLIRINSYTEEPMDVAPTGRLPTRTANECLS